MPGHRHHTHHSSHSSDGHVHAGHGSIRLDPAAPRRRSVHRLGRRRFLAELGRNTVAVAILGGLAAACSTDDDADDAEAVDDAAPATSPDDAVATEPTAGNGPAWAQVALGFVSAYVVVRGNEAAVVDTGTPGSTPRIGETLTTLGVTLDDVRHVILTHSHPDHIGSLPDVLGQAPSATPYAGEADIPNITSPIDVAAVGDGDDVFGLEVIATPGHTPGSISLLDTGIGLLIAGDALNGNDDGTAITGPNEQFSADMSTATASVDKLAALEFEIAAFGHGQPVTQDADDLVRALT